jgi:uncharacterized protein
MIVAITGASGFVGQRLSEKLRAEGHTIRAVSLRTGLLVTAFQDCEAVVHLAGEPVAQRWTPAARTRIQESRVAGTRRLIGMLAKLERKPRVLVSASAVGYYGSRGDEILTESSPPAQDFLGQVATAWESEAHMAEALGIRVVIPRIGVVLGRGGGGLSQMLLPFKLGVGGRLGTGKQWMSWIHIDDLCALISFAIRHDDVNGPINAVSPTPVTNADFTRALGRAIHRPAIFPVPAVALTLLFGEMSTILLGGQRVLPQAAQQFGFQFKYPDLASALRDAVRR